jgi:hypothetical protein
MRGGQELWNGVLLVGNQLFVILQKGYWRFIGFFLSWLGLARRSIIKEEVCAGRDLW